MGSIIFLGAVFEAVPIGNGTLALIEAASRLHGRLAYVTLRLAGVGSGLAWATLAVAIVVLVFNLVYPLGALLQHGAFRFGMPMVIVWRRRPAKAERSGRGPSSGHPGGHRSARLAVVASRHSCTHSERSPASPFPGGDGAGRTACGSSPAVLQVLVAGLVVQVVFALATLAASGELPNWGNT